MQEFLISPAGFAIGQACGFLILAYAIQQLYRAWKHNREVDKPTFLQALRAAKRKEGDKDA